MTRRPRFGRGWRPWPATKSYRAVLARGVPVPHEPADLTVIGAEGAVRAALARLHDAGAA